MKENEYVDLQVTFKTYTDKAVLIAYDDEEHWIPRSLISYQCDQAIEDLERDEDFTLTVVGWKAIQIGY